MAVQRYKTAGEIINAAAKELGLGAAADPYSSSDVNFQQLTQMLDSVGTELLDHYEWEHLKREHTFTTVLNQSEYDLPADFLSLYEQTAWNRTQQLPLIGPISPEVWQTMVATATAQVSQIYRVRTNQIWIGPPGNIPAAETIAFEYKSRAWVRPAASGLGNGDTLGSTGQDRCVVTGDFPLFEPLLLQYGVKLMFKKDKGFDTTTAEADFMRVLGAAQNRSGGAASILPIAPAPRTPFHGQSSVPDTFG